MSFWDDNGRITKSIVDVTGIFMESGTVRHNGIVEDGPAEVVRRPLDAAHVRSVTKCSAGWG